MTDTTSAFAVKWKKEVSGDDLYNADLAPIQHPILRNEWTNILNPEHREKIYEFSPYLREHTVKIFKEIVARGWTLEKDEVSTVGEEKGKTDDKTIDKKPKISKPSDKVKGSDLTDTSKDVDDELDEPEWSTELKNQFIEALALGSCVDTSFLFKMKENKAEGREVIRTMSRNYVVPAEVFGNKDRQIDEVTLKFPKLTELRHKDNSPFIAQEQPFFTQYSEKPITKDGDNKGRHCVVVQLVPDLALTFGKPFAIRECQTALEKLGLRFYETLSLHKGGMLHEYITIPKLHDTTIAENIKKDIKRGMMSRGGVIEIPSKLDIGKVYNHESVPLGKMDFDVISRHISEDSPVSQQKSTGANMGASIGPMPIVAQEGDEDYTTEMQDLIAPVIKDVNYVFFGKDPKGYHINFEKKLNETMQPGMKKDDNPDAATKMKRGNDLKTKTARRQQGKE